MPNLWGIREYTLTYMSENEIVTEVTQQEQEDLRKWDADYQELMWHTKNLNYGRFKCFHCLLSPGGNDPIFIGINRLVVEGLNNGTLQGDGIQYPCQVVNRFQCPFVDDLFRLYKLAFAAEISLAKVRKDDSEIRIKNKKELLHALADKETFDKMLEQGAEAHKVSGYIRGYLREKQTYILDYFMRMKNLVNAKELRFY